jgi:hypothetical protein
MSQDFPKLTRDELDEVTGEPLPERTAMSIITPPASSLPAGAVPAGTAPTSGALPSGTTLPTSTSLPACTLPGNLDPGNALLGGTIGPDSL